MAHDEAAAAAVKKPLGRNRRLQSVTAQEVADMLRPETDGLPPSRIAVAPAGASTAVAVPEMEILPPLDTADDFVAEVARLWRASQDHAVDIGRRLNEAKAKLEHGEFMQMTGERLPFSHSVANRLMRVASAVDSGRYPLERLPNNYSIVDQLVTLSAEEWRAAEEEGVVRPDVSIREVTAFKRKMREQTSQGDGQARRRLTRLLAQRDRLEQEIADLRRALGEEE
jgi:hypothetical protein